MVSKSSFTSKLTRDPRQRAETYAREGRKQKAAELYAQAGDFRQAAKLAAEAGDERLAVDCALKAAFGANPPAMPAAGVRPGAPQGAAPGAPPGTPTPALSSAPQPQPPGTSRPPEPLPSSPQTLKALQPLEAAELLAAHGHHDQAIALFELAHAYRRAAACALALRQSARAARLFERGRALSEAAAEFERAELLDDALRVLELEAKRLGRNTPARLDAAAQEQLARLDLRRAEVLRKLGRDDEAAALLRDVRPTSGTVRLLESSGKLREAIEAALQMGDAETAVRLLHRAPEIDRRLAAQIYLRSGHAIAAGDLFAALGMSREAAEAYESGGDWAKAGSRWETALEHERAAEAYQRGRRPRDAGRCYAAIGKSQLAAAAFAKAGDHTAAAEHYLKARQRVAAAAELAAAGDRAAAVSILMQVADNSPERESATLQLVPLLLEQGESEEALRRMRQLPPIRPSALTPSADRALVARDRLYWMARAYEQLGRLEQAESCYAELADPTVEHRDALARLVAVRERRQPGAAARPSPSPAQAAMANAGAGGAGHTAAYPSLPPGQTPRPFVPAASGRPLDESATRATVAQPAAEAAAPRPHFGRRSPSAADTPAPPPSAGGRPMGTLSVGQVLAGRFQILDELGQGGMGRVYKAHDFELGELVAIKMLSSQADDGSADAERLLREVQICRKITHPNVVRVFDLGRHEGSIFIIMELLEGQVLVDLIDPARPVSLVRVKTILTEISSGLQEAHNLGVVHRDLKPENVILTATRLKILDFGIARMTGFDKRLTQAGFALGSPLYMSPEQIQGVALDSRSDLYSLGVLAFALIAGREPFDGANSTAIAIQHLQQPPPDLRTLRSGLPQGWNDVVAKLLAKRPDERYQATQEVIAALAPLPVEQ